MISSLCKQRRKGAPFAHLAYELWRELDASGLATGNAALYAAGGEALSHSFMLLTFTEVFFKQISAWHLYASNLNGVTVLCGVQA